MTRKLPIGIHSFARPQKDGCVYVDSIAYVYMVSEGSASTEGSVFA